MYKAGAVLAVLATVDGCGHVGNPRKSLGQLPVWTCTGSAHYALVMMLPLP